MAPNFEAAWKMHLCEVGAMYRFCPLPHLWLWRQGGGVMCSVSVVEDDQDRMLNWSHPRRPGSGATSTHHNKARRVSKRVFDEMDGGQVR
jgi:hypothetical protein